MRTVIMFIMIIPAFLVFCESWMCLTGIAYIYCVAAFMRHTRPGRKLFIYLFGRHHEQI